MKKISYYEKLPYTKIIKQVTDESGTYYVGSILEIPEAKTVGDTLKELDDNLQEALLLSIKVRMEEKEPIPEPMANDEEYSGKFVVRVPKDLHRVLSLQAKKQGISLNQYALYKLAK